MASPFPGMDPYVERPDLWGELHNPFMMYARDELQPLLPAHYVARLELRVYLERGEEAHVSPARKPDLEVVRRGSGSGVAVAEPEVDWGYWIETGAAEQREAFLSIRTVPDQELVTSVELLSPTNKRSGDGWREYRRKQAEMLAAGVNLVEIDLLRGGIHTVAVDRGLLAHLPPFDYRISMHRAERPGDVRVGPWTVREPLPQIPIPLGAGEPTIRLNTSDLFARCYQNAAFEKLIDYRREPEPPLKAEDAAWADQLLREAGLRGEGG